MNLKYLISFLLIFHALPVTAFNGTHLMNLTDFSEDRKIELERLGVIDKGENYIAKDRRWVEQIEFVDFLVGRTLDLYNLPGGYKYYLVQTNLSGVNFNKADLHFATFAGSVCIETQFKDAQLFGADFSCAFMGSVDFRGADLKASRFDNAELLNTNFENADLNGAIFKSSTLTNINLTGANLTDTQFISCKFN